MTNKYLRQFLAGGVILVLTAACGGGGGDGGSRGESSGTFTRRAPSGEVEAYSGSWRETPAYFHWQFLYLPDDMKASGRITAISFEYVLAQTAVTCPNVTVKMGHSRLANQTSTFANNVNNGKGSLATVMENGTVNFPAGAVGDLATIELPTPFEYNGVDGLVMEFERTAACSGTVYDRAMSPTAYNAITSSTSNGSPTGTVDTYVDHITFTFEGGEKVTVAADRGADNGNFVAPAATGRTQYLILAGDIQGSGPVTGIRFPLEYALSVPLSGTYKITLSHVAGTTVQLGETFADNVGSNATVVADGLALNLPVGTDSFWAPLTGRFDYDGTSNLLIDVEATVTAGQIQTRYQNAGGNRLLRATTPGAATGGLWERTLEPTLRFSGGPLFVVSQGAANSSGQVLGAGLSGQMQSLYRNDRLGTGGTIRNVYVRLSGASPAATTLGNYKLYMGHTAKQSYTTADTYASNMDENTLVMSGSLSVPAGLATGDWLKIPLATPFDYDPARNLSILFTTDAGTAGNEVVASQDADQLANHSVGRNDNGVSTTGTPTWSFNGIVDVKLDLR